MLSYKAVRPEFKPESLRFLIELNFKLIGGFRSVSLWQELAFRKKKKKNRWCEKARS